PYQGENSERKDLSQYDVKVSGTKEDNSPPTLKNLNVTPRDVTKGDIVNVEADVSDDLSGV
ncbi:hypothetical protein, partial [Halobacillus trueperi]|uniref:hypothetical protein n=1 Tax=Halobacillus trueperi TaxID=156205 RepID=UPI0015F26977